MPRKRRSAKRRVTEAEEERAWSMMLRCGADYLSELKPFGIMTHQEALEAAPKAWRRFGRALMDAYDADPNKRLPWAYDQFGEPEKCQ